MATLNLGRIKPVFRGAWTSGAFVIDDIVTHGNESFICIQAGTNIATSDASYWTKLAAKGTDGTDVGTTITTQGDILYRDGSGLQRLAKGTAGQVLKMNTGANAPEWGTEAGGQIVKITTFENATRQTLSGSTNGTIFDNMAVTKVKDATTSKIIAIGMIPGEYHASYHSGIYFVCKTTGMDNSGTNDSTAFRGIGQSYGGDTDAPGIMIVNKTFEDTTNLGTGTHNFKIGWRDRAGGSEKPADVINYNSSDDGRAHQAGTEIQFMEVLR